MKEYEICEDSYSIILKRFKYTLLNDCTIINEKIINIVKKLNSIIQKSIKIWKLINKKGLPFNSLMQHSADMNNIYTNIKQMAMGDSIEGGKLYKNKELFNDIIYSLDYMHENY